MKYGRLGSKIVSNLNTKVFNSYKFKKRGRGEIMEKEGRVNINIINYVSFLLFIIFSIINPTSARKNGYTIQNTVLKTKNNIDNLIKNKVEEIKQYADAEMSLFKFELALSSIPEKERLKATKSVQKYRKEKWTQALKLAKGNEEKAFSIYGEI